MTWFIAFTFSIAISAWSQAPPEPVLSCVREGGDACKEARFQLPKMGNDDFSKMFEVRRLKFIEWIKPTALFVQGVTGMPASVFIAQAGLASDWGSSPAFRNNNNIFKHMCWVPQSSITGEVELGGKKYAYKGTCGVEKIFANVGRPFKFNSREDSILAYLHQVLLTPSKAYKPLQDELKRGLKSLPPRQASYRSVAAVLNPFSADNKYIGLVQHMIQVEKLSIYDVAACWQCLIEKQSPEQK